MRSRLLILETVVDVVVRTAIVFALFLLFSGHNAPGGGFIGGLVGGSCLILIYLAEGEAGVTRLARLRPDHYLGVGLMAASLVGMAGWVWGSTFLESNLFSVELPVLGLVKAPSALVFDIGVFSVVIGLAAALISSVGDESTGDDL